MKNSAISILCACCVAGAAKYQVSYMEEADAFIKGTSQGLPLIYEVKSRALSENDLEAKAAYLGFAGKDRQKVKATTIIKDEAKGQVLSYDEDNSMYRYRNGHVNWLKKGQPVDHEDLKGKAARHLQGLLGSEAADFQLSGMEYTSIQDKGDPGPSLASVTFRYLRRQNNRPIHGVTNDLRIELGDGGNVKSLNYSNAELVPSKTMARTPKRDRLKELLQKQMDRNLFEQIPNLKSVKVVKGEESYFAKKEGSKTLLYPHYSFLTEEELTDNRSIRGWVHVDTDVDNIPNLAESDIEGTPTK